jgi:hypothetical protein
MCGAVRYEAVGEPMTTAYCHCLSCRRHTGAPAVTWIAFEADQVRFHEGQRKLYNSSPGVDRAFCGDCDTPLIWEGISRRFAGKSIIELHVSTLDDQTLFKPDRHWFESERIGWFDIDDKLPRYSELDGPGQVPVHFGAKTD